MPIRATIILTLVLLTTAACAGTETVRVGLLRTDPPQSLRVIGPCLVERDSGRHRIDSGGVVTIRCSGNGLLVQGAGTRSNSPSVTLSAASSGGTVALEVDGGRKTYRGKIDIRARDGSLLVVNRLDVEDYLRSVLPGEMPQEWPVQAQAAQAVVARSFAVAGMGRHARDGFDLCDTTHCQVYRGASWERPTADRAVGITRGEVLTFRGKCVASPYHSTCGGRTSSGGEAFLEGVVDGDKTGAYCRRSDHFRWSCTLSSDDVRRALAADGHRITDSIRDVRVAARDSSDRAVRVEIGASQKVEISAASFMLACGRHLGWNKIKSTLFEVKKTGGGFAFTGRGLGHGMGLCQWGARGMADRGCSYREILNHYYPKCSISGDYSRGQR